MNLKHQKKNNNIIIISNIGSRRQINLVEMNPMNVILQVLIKCLDKITFSFINYYYYWGWKFFQKYKVMLRYDGFNVVSTSQNRVVNRNRNCGAYHNLEIFQKITILPFQN